MYTQKKKQDLKYKQNYRGEKKSEREQDTSRKSKHYRTKSS